MSIVTTYICDVSGKSGMDRAEFVVVDITAQSNQPTSYDRTVRIQKYVHIDVAKKLGLVTLKSTEAAIQELSFEAKLTALLVPYIDQIVEDAVSDHLSNRG